MFVRISDRGEPAKINFCRLRTDSMENRPDSPFAGAAGETSASDCTALSTNRPSFRLGLLFESSSRCRNRQELGGFWHSHLTEPNVWFGCSNVLKERTMTKEN